MIRSAAHRASRSVTIPTHQRRSKTFERRVDKNNEVYYTLIKQADRGIKKNPKKDDVAYGEFFDMPNLLLDLDADGRDEVRSFDETVDEEAMIAKWVQDPKRKAVKDTLKKLEEQVQVSRLKAEAILNDRTNIWRITWSDILSASLHGAPKNDTTLQMLRKENGIPVHTVDDNALFLKWLLLRRQNLVSHIKQFETGPLAHRKFCKAMESQTTLTGVRRLTALYLDGIRDAEQREVEGEFYKKVVEACRRTAGQDTSSEALIFLHNMKERVGKESSQPTGVFDELIAELSTAKV